MATFIPNGASNTQPYSWYADPDWFRTAATAPSNLPPDWQGRQLGLFVGMRGAIGGVSNGTSARYFVHNDDGGDYHATNVFGISTGNAVWQSWQNLSSAKGFTAGMTFYYGVDQQWGSFRVGRGPVGGRNVDSQLGLSRGWPGYAFVAEISYATLPSAPGTPSMASPGVGKLTASWAAPSNNGDSAITSYNFDYATRSDFSNYSRINTGAQSVEITGLQGGVTYYGRCMAYNTVSNAWGTHSAVSGVGSVYVKAPVTPPPTPTDPTPHIKVSIGGVWVPITWLNDSINQSWVRMDNEVSKSGAWVNPT